MSERNRHLNAGEEDDALSKRLMVTNSGGEYEEATEAVTNLQQLQASTLSAESDDDDDNAGAADDQPQTSTSTAVAVDDAANTVPEDDWQEDEPSSSPAPQQAEEVAASSSSTAVSPPSDGNMRVVASHYNELKEAGRKERLKSRIVHMRNFNNWLKSQLIVEYLGRIKEQKRAGDPIRVLDMCCGKGGDLLKWEKANIRHLICTDIAKVSVEQCQQRYEDMKKRADSSKYSSIFSAEFFACDSTLVRLRERYKDKSLELNLVSCQFAFHYSFESLSQAECMIRNAAECLQQGGYFIATIPDANEIMRRARASDNGRQFGNEVYNIEFVSDVNESAPPLFGAKYQFHLEGVVDCPEFLVHFPTLVKLCRKHGLQLERRTTFTDYYKETFDKGRSLLQRMNGLETVSPHRVKNDEQFSHLLNTTTTGGSVGTLSKDEWEATTLYLVCAFRKGKTTWDSEGKPVFEFN